MGFSNGLRKVGLGALLLWAVFAAPQAAAAVIGFETGAPALIAPPSDVYTESGFVISMDAGLGVIDTDATCLFGQCPAGNATTFLSALNDGSVIIRHTLNHEFAISGFDAGFFAPLFIGVPDVQSGQLTVTGIKSSGARVSTTFNLGDTDADGVFNFNTYALRSSFTGLRSVTMSACVFTDFGCEFGTDEALNLSQFSVDNIGVSVVPEPATLAFLSLGLCGLLLARRARR
jgi:PEP-CTERM motif